MRAALSYVLTFAFLLLPFAFRSARVALLDTRADAPLYSVFVRCFLKASVNIYAGARRVWGRSRSGRALDARGRRRGARGGPARRGAGRRVRRLSQRRTARARGQPHARRLRPDGARRSPRASRGRAPCRQLPTDGRYSVLDD